MFAPSGWCGNLRASPRASCTLTRAFTERQEVGRCLVPDTWIMQKSRLCLVMLRTLIMKETPPMIARALSRECVLAVAVLTLALPSTPFAQTGAIAGKVTDRDTKQPIAEVHVLIAGTALETQTNRE